MVVGILVWIATPALCAAAQTPPAVSGLVVDETGGAIEGAVVSARGADGAVHGKTLTGPGGAFSLTALPAGRYTLEIEKALFEPMRVDVDLLEGGPADSRRVTLRVSGVREAVTVAPNVDERPAGQAVTIDRDDFTNTRTVSTGDVVVFSVGVTVVQANGPCDVSVSIRGSTARTAFGIRNIQVYSVLANSGSIWAGTPRSFFAGARV
jgi:iron complex outermembrane receptor protein